jgi:hypothetical protein
MGALEPEIEAGITYMPDNSPEMISATLERVIGGRWYERKAVEAAQQTYGPAGVAKSLDSLLNQVMNERAEKNKWNGGTTPVGPEKRRLRFREIVRNCFL